MLIRSHSRGSHDPGFGSRGGSESFDRSAPAQIARKVLGGDAVEAPDPFFESAMVGVHVVDVMFGRLRLWVSGSGQHVEFESGASRERGNGRPSIAAKVRGRGDRAAQRGRNADGIEPRQDGVQGRARAVTGDEDWDLFRRQAAFAGFASPLARRSGKVFALALEQVAKLFEFLHKSSRSI